MQGDAAVAAPDRQRDGPADAQDGHLRRHHDQRRMTAGDGSEIRQRDGRAAQIGGRQASGLHAALKRIDLPAPITEANRLPYGLAAYAYTRSTKTMAAIGADLESGMVSINHHGLALPEIPFGGTKDSGYGSEADLEAIDGYLNTKLVTQASA